MALAQRLHDGGAVGLDERINGAAAERPEGLAQLTQTASSSPEILTGFVS
jgi:hypothetical protein